MREPHSDVCDGVSSFTPCSGQPINGLATSGMRIGEQFWNGLAQVHTSPLKGLGLVFAYLRA
jgi:hypothetical protein